MARDVRVAFKLSEEKKSELEEYAASYGVTMSGLCALIVGQWLHQQEKVQKPMVQAVTQALTEQMAAMIASMDKEAIEDMLDKSK